MGQFDDKKSESTLMLGGARRIAAVTPSDSADLSFQCRALVCPSAGTVKLTTIGGDTDTVYVVAGTILPVLASRVWETGTSVTSMTAMA